MRANTFFKGAVFGALVGGMALVSSVAFAGGGLFGLGTTNPANPTTKRKGSTNGLQLRVVNSSTGKNAGGVGIVTADNVPPLAVHSKARVTNLNADMVDGLHG